MKHLYAFDKFLFPCLLILTLASTPATAAFDYKKGLESTSGSMKYDTQERALRSYEGVTYINKTESNGWNVGANGYWYDKASDTGIMAGVRPILIQETSNGFTFIQVHSEIAPPYYDKVMSAKNIGKQAEYMKKKSGIEYQITRQGNSPVFKGSYSGDKIQRALDRLVRGARYMIHHINTADAKARAEYTKKRQKEKIKSIAIWEFPDMMDDQSLSGVYGNDSPELVKNGIYSFGSESLNLEFEMEMHEKKILIYVSRDFSDKSEAERKNIAQELSGYMNKKKLKGADTLEGVVNPDDTDWVSAKIIINLDGTHTGADIRKTYNTLWNKYSKSISKQLDKLS